MEKDILSFNIDRNMNTTVTMNRPKCKKQTNVSMKNINPSSVITCNCGFNASFAGNDLSKLQRALTELNRTSNSLSK